ncbi:aspartate aminotransferase [Methylophilales bacterium MBRSG12]|uniref:Aminotransferase n=1 Tax=Methylophilales bacterium MBRS-H7 TaxID=1623450 RepID=A0A0H4IWF9_9PROT|nr:aspartate aminotransferase [Methylophilales bacterium MBRSF5]AKO65281.1 aspartate aminotransferase [Methylophilales bacterium MBRS-H7]AKO66600.1 aspartate aminotransferase [Methylophilales bacterium MBRSG12]
MSDNITLSSAVQRIKESPTLAVTAKASLLKLQGIDIIGLAAGEPDFDTPEFIKQGAIQAINDGKTKYTPVGGIPSLKNAIADKFKNDNGLDYKAEEIVVGVGGKQCIFNLCLSVLDAGDEVVIPAPYWVSYEDIAVLTGAEAKIISTTIKDNFKITAEQLNVALTEKTKLVFLNSPSNPTGSVYTKEELLQLATVLHKYPNVIIASDDIYEHINLNDQDFNNIVMEDPSLKDRSVILNGVSKAYSMTGWRIGYAAGPTKIIKAMTKLQSQSTSNPSSISQAAAETALRGNNECIAEMVKEFKLRHTYVVENINNIDGLSCIPAEGAFYAFPYAQDAIDRLFKANVISKNNDIGFCEYLLDKANVAVVPGSAFGAEGYFRLSFATSMENLVEAISRIKKAVEI